MRRQQEEKLVPMATEQDWDAQWHTSLHEVPQDPTKFTLLVAHEFFDALPFNLIQVCPSTPCCSLHSYLDARTENAGRLARGHDSGSRPHPAHRPHFLGSQYRYHPASTPQDLISTTHFPLPPGPFPSPHRIFNTPRSLVCALQGPPARQYTGNFARDIQDRAADW